MTKVTVEFDGMVDAAQQGVILLEMEKSLRLEWGDLDVRVLKAKMADDSLLRIKKL